MNFAARLLAKAALFTIILILSATLSSFALTSAVTCSPDASRRRRSPTAVAVNVTNDTSTESESANACSYIDLFASNDDNVTPLSSNVTFNDAANVGAAVGAAVGASDGAGVGTGEGAVVGDAVTSVHS